MRDNIKGGTIKNKERLSRSVVCYQSLGEELNVTYIWQDIWEDLFNRFDLKYERKRKAPRILTPRLID